MPTSSYLRPPRSFIFYATLFFVITQCIATWAQAGADNISLRSDQLELNTKDGNQTATGNVVFIDQKVNIKADKLVVAMRKDAITRLLGEGSPVTVLIKDEPLSMQADRIEYITRKWTLSTGGNTLIQHSHWTLSAHSASYNYRTRILKTSGQDGSKVHLMLLPPKK
ncbi:MAG: LptA/OstA family protein [Pseudomonadota bacterium]